ncbi:hypothetical protein [Magnetovibrio sp.]|uniref:hypothetical protein n=1 Tax=Magnetovibrio sp. TaxID=2024836 RepID=UPI002F91E3C6
MYGMISRRRFLVGFPVSLGTMLFSRLSRGNPLFLFLRFFFGAALRGGARSGLRMLGRRMIGRGGRSRLIRRSGNQGVRSTSRAAMIASAPEKEKKWTNEFVKMGLEELVLQSLDIVPAVADEDIEIPDGAPVYEIHDHQSAQMEIEVENKSNELQAVAITLYLYDIDAGLVDTKYPHIFASVQANRTQKFKIDLKPLKYQGRKVICVKQDGFEGRVSPMIYFI